MSACQCSEKNEFQLISTAARLRTLIAEKTDLSLRDLCKSRVCPVLAHWICSDPARVKFVRANN
jgi:hypothetical protein